MKYEQHVIYAQVNYVFFVINPKKIECSFMNTNFEKCFEGCLHICGLYAYI